MYKKKSSKFLLSNLWTLSKCHDFVKQNVKMVKSLYKNGAIFRILWQIFSLCKGTRLEILLEIFVWITKFLRIFSFKFFLHIFKKSNLQKAIFYKSDKKEYKFYLISFLKAEVIDQEKRINYFRFIRISFNKVKKP